MKKDEDSYKGFQFKKVEMVKLKALLGPSQAVLVFLGNVERWINRAIWVRDKETYAPSTPGQMEARLLEYERLCNTFVRGMIAIDADLSKPDVKEWEKDWEAILLIEAASLTYKDGQLSASDGFVSDVVETVRILGKFCANAKDGIPPPKQGDLSAYERNVQMTEDGIVNAYIQAFDCYPAKTNSGPLQKNSGAFHEAMKIFYKCAGYSSGNSFQRMCKAIDRCAEAAGHIPIPKQFKAKHGLHPSRRLHEK